MKVCYFGSYERQNYNMLLKKILEKQGIEVIECQNEITGFYSFVKSNFKLAIKHSKITYDVMIIPWRGIMTLPLAKIISRKPIVYVAFISIYDTLVNDRKTIKQNSIKAKIIHFIDKMSIRLSNLVFTETYATRDYYVKEFGVDQSKFKRVFLSADEEKFQPCSSKKQNDKFTVLYFGSFIPLHGVQTIIETAQILSDQKDIEFKLCGKGQELEFLKNLALDYNLENIDFLGFVSHDILIENIQQSDVCLGIFGNSQKAENVVTNKVFQILASNRPLITMDSKAVREIKLENNKNCILIPKNNPQELAKAILSMRDNPQNCFNIAASGNKLYLENLSMEKTGKTIVKYFSELV